LQAVVQRLIATGSVRVSGESTEGVPTELEDQTRLESQRFLVPVGDERGFEVAVFDHYRAVLDAIASKLRLRGEDPQVAQLVGGTTLVFDLPPAHPLRQEVLGLLERVRADAGGLWKRVSEYNRAHAFERDELTTVTFYFGQNVEVPSKDNNRD
jgi:hypothetical protein